jgi:hypothetical protein
MGSTQIRERVPAPVPSPLRGSARFARGGVLFTGCSSECRERNRKLAPGARCSASLMYRAHQHWVQCAVALCVHAVAPGACVNGVDGDEHLEQIASAMQGYGREVARIICFCDITLEGAKLAESLSKGSIKVAPHAHLIE